MTPWLHLLKDREEGRYFLSFLKSHLREWYKTGVLKLRTSTFLCTLRLLKLYFGNQIWKFMCRYSDKFSSSFPKFDLFFVLWTFNYNKIVLQLKSLRTADVVYTSKNINSLHYNIYCVSKTK